MPTGQYKLSKLADRVIAIDGPAGSGKSTTSRLLAAKLGYQYLDTGAMYRALTYFAITKGIAPSDAAKLSALAKVVDISFKTEAEINHVYINGEEVTNEIRTPAVTALVSEVSAHKGVREAMVAKQKEIGKKGSIVAEGRDTTTAVFPHADIKVYMDASVKQRAQRRLIDLAKMGIATTLEEQIADIERRDSYDSGRQHSPLMRANDAVIIDTTSLTIEQQVERIITILKSVLK
jgi:cytidylate kinase